MDNARALMAISPLDGRYANKTSVLNEIFSEYALMHHRVWVEIEWLKTLQPELSSQANIFLENIVTQFSLQDASHIKTIEQTTNHDVKAVEYFIKEKMQTHKELKAVSEWVHFACTSEDINNVAYALMLKSVRTEVIAPCFDQLLATLTKMTHEYAATPMLARTHGQAATPTTLGKELANVVARLQHQIHTFSSIKINAKMNGAVGNFNAHVAAFPSKNWLLLSRTFVEKLGLHWNPYTTQIEPHDYIAELSHNMMRINNILIDFCRDVWGYISLGYFSQARVENEVGSSTMPHKINPIDFENAEGNFYLANAIFHTLADKLTLSRWQRDLVDSTLLRNLGVAFGHALVAYQSLLKGLSRIAVNHALMLNELQQHWELLAEPIQMILRANNVEEPYEKLKSLTRGQVLNQQQLHAWIDELSVSKEIKQQLKQLKPESYLGLAAKLAEDI